VLAETCHITYHWSKRQENTKENRKQKRERINEIGRKKVQSQKYVLHVGLGLKKWLNVFDI
jgi:hypothetical protein